MGWTFSLEEASLWIMDLCIVYVQNPLMDLLQTHSFSLHKVLFDGLDSCGLLVMLLSAVWTLVLTAPIHCRASIGEQVM